MKPPRMSLLAAEIWLHQPFRVQVASSMHHGNSGSGHYTVYRKVKVSKELEEETASCMAGNPRYSNHLLFSNQQEKTNSENNLCWSTKVKSMHKRNSDVLWFKISDSDVERVAEKSVLGSDASLLFYEKIGDTD